MFMSRFVFKIKGVIIDTQAGRHRLSVNQERADAIGGVTVAADVLSAAYRVPWSREPSLEALSALGFTPLMGTRLTVQTRHVKACGVKKNAAIP